MAIHVELSAERAVAAPSTRKTNLLPTPQERTAARAVPHQSAAAITLAYNAPVVVRCAYQGDRSCNGTICGTGRHDAFPTVNRLWVLLGTECPADVDRNNCVEFGDLLLVLGNWDAGPCNIADVNCDGAVGFMDLILVLASWSCGDCEIGLAPSGIMDCINKYPNDPLRQSKCIEAMILANTP